MTESSSADVGDDGKTVFDLPDLNNRLFALDKTLPEVQICQYP